MEKFILKEEVKTWGFQVKNCPDGIGEAFDRLVQLLPGRFDRSFFGISKLTMDGRFIYIAATEEIHEEEAKKYNCERYIIEAGEYFCITLRDWRKKTDTIKGIFHAMMNDARADRSKPCVEWYKDDIEMFCMVKVFESSN